MFFILSKTIGLIAVPSNLLVMIGLAGIALLPTRFGRAGRRLLVTSVILIAAIGVLPVGNALILPLEQRFPRWDPVKGTPAVVIVLGGAIYPEISAARGQVSFDEAAERLTAAVELARQYPTARIVFSGGSANLLSGLSEADYAAHFIENLGVPRDRITVESRSRDTAENAVFTKHLITPKSGEHWLLVTSAFHMPRAIGAFRQAGFPVEAYPVDYQTAGWGDLWVFSALARGIAKTDAAVHEWQGLFVYWLTGRIPVLFPRTLIPAQPPSGGRASAAIVQVCGEGHLGFIDWANLALTARIKGKIHYPAVCLALAV
jgi:uncharacterized SAM-binding protein YcdF (DUF218 family)